MKKQEKRPACRDISHGLDDPAGGCRQTRRKAPATASFSPQRTFRRVGRFPLRTCRASQSLWTEGRRKSPPDRRAACIYGRLSAYGRASTQNYLRAKTGRPAQRVKRRQTRVLLFRLIYNMSLCLHWRLPSILLRIFLRLRELHERIECRQCEMLPAPVPNTNWNWIWKPATLATSAAIPSSPAASRRGCRS